MSAPKPERMPGEESGMFMTCLSVVVAVAMAMVVETTARTGQW